MFHRFPELNGGMPTLVRSLNLEHNQGQNTEPAELTYLISIAQKGYVWRTGGYASKALPKMTFEYQWLAWNKEVKAVSAENLVHAPIGLSGNYQWTDLYNEGINGILTEQANAWYYKSNQGPDENGEVRFSPAREVAPKPSWASARCFFVRFPRKSRSFSSPGFCEVLLPQDM